MSRTTNLEKNGIVSYGAKAAIFGGVEDPRIGLARRPSVTMTGIPLAGGSSSDGAISGAADSEPRPLEKRKMSIKPSGVEVGGGGSAASSALYGGGK
jgi:hypothetical protein